MGTGAVWPMYPYNPLHLEKEHTMFFDGYTSQQLIVGLVGMILVVLHELFPGINLFQAIKAKWGFADNILRFIVLAIFMALAGLASYLTGELTGWVWTLQGMLEYFGWFYIPANIAYQMLKDQKAQ